MLLMDRNLTNNVILKYLEESDMSSKHTSAFNNRSRFMNKQPASRNFTKYLHSTTALHLGLSTRGGDSCLDLHLLLLLFVRRFFS